MDTFGSYLKRHREAKGIRLEEIASITKIHLHSLELLESDRWDKLPPDPFLRGFIVAYAKYVGLDPREAVQRFQSEVRPSEAGAPGDSAAPSSPSAGAPLPATPGDLIERQPGISAKRLATVGGILVIVGILGSIVYLGKRATDASLKESHQEANQDAPASTPAASPESAPEGAPVTPPTSSVAPPSSPVTPAATPSVASAATPTPATADEAPHRIFVEGKERTWMKVTIDDKAPMEFFLPEAGRVSYSAKEKIKVVLGNGSGAKVTYNGQPAEGKGMLGSVRSFRYPANARFPQDIPARKTSDTAAAEDSGESEEALGLPTDPTPTP